MITHDRRIARLEAERGAADVALGVLFIPPHLAPHEARAWLSELPPATGGATGVVVVPRKGSVR